MSHIIVLVKQVPDVSQITDNAFDPKAGNLIRTRLPSVINELDTQALAFACYMKQLSGDTKGKIICLTMGPPMAAEVLRYGLGRCADAAVLLTDHALGGADTWATANPLAYAVRKIYTELLGGSNDYLIVAGMQSVDGDTAQVPAQMAEELQIPCIPYTTKAEYENGQFSFTRIISGGSQVVQPLRSRAMITVAKYEHPLFASFARTRMANKMELIQWGADDVKATAVGVAGSKTRVIRVFPPGKTTRKCQAVASAKELATIIIDKLGQDSNTVDARTQQAMGYLLPEKRADKLDRSYEGTEKENEDYVALAHKLKELSITDLSKMDEETTEKILADDTISFHKKALEDMLEGLKKTTPEYTGDVWVMAEHSDGVVNAATFELTGKARELADSLSVRVGVVLPGDSVLSMANELIATGADDVYVIEHPLLKEFDPRAYCKAVSSVFTKYKPQIFLYGATPQGRVLAPMVSYRVGCGLTADCTGLEIRDSSRKGQIAVLMQTRPALGGNVMATICTKDSTCQMATARPGVMKRLPEDKTRTGKIIEHSVELNENDLSLKIIQTEKGRGQVNFDSDAIVSGGKGMQNRDTYDRLLDNLCNTIRNQLHISVEKGATRTAVEQGFTERIHQVGQTGTAVGPKLYIAIGISGAIQHMIGVANTETIIAINTDPNAPIFKQCDYYIVGSAEQVVPELVAALNTK
ncbi:MAG: electron transfer flavoprotein subunit beta [Phycisphaerae bacterium]|nr:electron transfer flavoprotein subunit beta [Phycisphaerae bacterium]